MYGSPGAKLRALQALQQHACTVHAHVSSCLVIGQYLDALATCEISLACSTVVASQTQPSDVVTVAFVNSPVQWVLQDGTIDDSQTSCICPVELMTDFGTCMQAMMRDIVQIILEAATTTCELKFLKSRQGSRA